jgi:hypothetical protein
MMTTMMIHSLHMMRKAYETKKLIALKAIIQVGKYSKSVVSSQVLNTYWTARV